MLEMRYGRTLLAGLGWVGTLGGLALCVLIFLSAFLAFDDDKHGVKPRKDDVVRLPSIPDAEVPRVPLARPPARIARGDDGGGGGGGGAPASAATPRPGTTTPRATAPVETTPQAPVEADPPAAAAPSPSPAGSNPPPESPSPLPPPPSAPTLGDTAREVVGAVGTGVGRISPPAGQVIEDTGDTLGDAVDALIPRR
jgi:hypothetical protein